MPECPVCGDKGLVRVRFESGEPDRFGICLCEWGERLRVARNGRHATNPLWQAVAAQRGIPLEAVVPLESLYDPEELAPLFPALAPPAPPAETLEAALIAAGRTRRRGRR